MKKDIEQLKKQIEILTQRVNNLETLSLQLGYVKYACCGNYFPLGSTHDHVGNITIVYK
ncbi:MAG: hypothetical protein AABY22_22450 [Nanoarchaeota archaeon]